MNKIIFIISELNIGGAEKLLVNLSAGLKDEFDIEVIYFTGDAPLLNKFDKIGILVTKFEMKGRISYSAYRKLIRYLKERKPAIVHTHLFRADIYGVFAAKKAKVPIIISTKHNTDDFRKSGGFWTWLDRKSMRKCTRIVSVSEAVRQFFREYEKVNVSDWTVIRNGIDIESIRESFNRTPQKQKILEKINLNTSLPTVSTIGRLARQKGQIFLIEAIEKLLKLGLEINLIIAGDGPERKNLEDYIESNNLSKYIRLTGFVDDITEVLKATDIFVYPSQWEGLGISILEAQAVGIPVIASDVDGIKEIIKNKYNGLLIPHGNPEEIALCIRKLLKNEKLTIELTKNATENLVKEFTLNKFIQDHKQLYNELLKE